MTLRRVQLLLIVCIHSITTSRGFSLAVPPRPKKSGSQPGGDSQNNDVKPEQLEELFQKPHQKTAIILNTNARSVSPQLAPIAEKVFGAENVFLTTDEDQAKEAASQIIRNRNSYKVVVPVGGDGTLSSMINFMCDELIKQNTGEAKLSVKEAVKELPLIGYIPLGTGNGVGSVVGCQVTAGSLRLPGAKKRRMKQIEYIMECLKSVSQQSSDDSLRPGPKNDNTLPYEVIDMPMMEVKTTWHDDHAVHQEKGDLCFFAGVGFDSLMLNDFKSIKAWSMRTGFLTKTLSSVAGYCVALVVKTLPNCALYGKHNVRVQLSTKDEDTLWVDHRRGDMVQRVAAHASSNPDGKQVLYSGTTGILAAGTSPFYGGGLRLFPFARLTTDKMHLRLGRINPLTGFINIPKIFEGSYRDKSDTFGCIDFIGGDFEVEVATDEHNGRKGFPFQHSGESIGHIDRFRLRVINEPVRFVSFLKKRVDVDEK
eukprot:CAMPEP_0195293536 /NCGR_PEP_ID=MMETSP0707-20130614/12685_1 /TAXON_ID=33640 /ORGANISM="Asterionellopsis glacialis, Strain CCMP134" /LENGTH=480 /DNA_ID=CAMNT_0040354275 /DNA_START=39 /DNA_END=1481 /DNA_ORIENTATION=+